MQPDEPSSTLTADPWPAGPTAPSRARGWAWTAVLVVLVAATSLALASSVSAWLVPPYLALMAWILLPAGGRRDHAGGRSEEDGTPAAPGAGAGAGLEGEAPGEGVALAPGAPAAEALAPAGPPEGPAEAPDPEPAGSKAKRGRGRGRKPKAAVTAPPPAAVTWVRVGPGKFVRVEGPGAAVTGPSESGEPGAECGVPEDPGFIPDSGSFPDSAPEAEGRAEATDPENTAEATPATVEGAEDVPPALAFATLTEVCAGAVPPECVTSECGVPSAEYGGPEDPGLTPGSALHIPHLEAEPGVPENSDSTPHPALRAPHSGEPDVSLVPVLSAGERGGPPDSGEELAPPDTPLPGVSPDDHPAGTVLSPGEEEPGGARDGVAEAVAEEHSAAERSEALEGEVGPVEVAEREALGSAGCGVRGAEFGVREDSELLAHLTPDDPPHPAPRTPHCEEVGPEPVYGNAPEAGSEPVACAPEQADEPPAVPPEAAEDVRQATDPPAQEAGGVLDSSTDGPPIPSFPTGGEGALAAPTPSGEGRGEGAVPGAGAPRPHPDPLPAGEAENPTPSPLVGEDRGEAPSETMPPETTSHSSCPAPSDARPPWISLRGAWPSSDPADPEPPTAPGLAPTRRPGRRGPRARGTLGFRRRSRRSARRRQHACRAFPPRPPPDPACRPARGTPGA